ncbi:SKN1-domain-containing protein, partial [Fistulina hepatica ATCC 64428]
FDKDPEALGQLVSQSAQFAPFTHDYVFGNTTEDEWKVWDPTISRQNSYRGSPAQQAVSGLTAVPPDMFQGSGRQFKVFGFEYWGDAEHRDEGFITWVSNGKPSVGLRAAAMGPDTGENGTGVGQRIVSEEPMSIVLNLGISHNWQRIDLGSMMFPAEMLIDYVRVYQRKDQKNVGCDPPDYPTSEYIDAHMSAYSNPNLTSWDSEKPSNRLYDGC